MLRTHTITVGLAVALLCLASTVVFAQEDTPVSTGVVATITALDARTGMATLQTEAGEVFELPKEWQWHVGHKVECDRITTAPRPRLQHCEPWESARHDTGAAQAGLAPRQAAQPELSVPVGTAQPDLEDVRKLSVGGGAESPARKGAPAFHSEPRAYPGTDEGR